MIPAEQTPGTFNSPATKFYRLRRSPDLGASTEFGSPINQSAQPSWAAGSLLAIGFVATAALTLLIARQATRALGERLAAESAPRAAGGAE